METKLSGETVRLTIPAALEYVRIVRLVASGAASRLGFDVEEIEDLRVAVDELTSLVIDASDGGELEIVFAVYDGALHIDGEVFIAVEQGGRVLPVEDLTGQILAAVVDEWSMEPVDGRVRFCCTKRLPTI